MKKIFLILFLLSIGFMLKAQVPQGVNYQSIIRDGNGEPMANQKIDIQFSILDSANAVEYQEKYTSFQTDAFGLVALTIGEVDSLKGDFESIRWSDGNKFLKVEIASQSGGTLKDMGTEKLKATFYALHAAHSGDWINVGEDDIYHLKGKVGIGLDSPEQKLHVRTQNAAIQLRLERSGSSIGYSDIGGRNGDLYLWPGGYWSGGTNLGNGDMLIRTTGNVGIGKVIPEANLHILGSGTIGLNDKTKAWFRIGDELFMDPNEIGFFGTDGNIYTNGSYDLKFKTNTINRMVITKDGKVGIGKLTPKTLLDIDGETTTKCLTIKGGCDITEPFEISNKKEYPAGTVLSIDEYQTGKLTISTSSYDKKVAGIISGAGDINPGLTLSQEGVMEDGQLVALSGRVYVRATSKNGSIKPGDMLTTSDLHGHAMKADDLTKSYGAVIGKAMSSLEAGEGLVLVLVNLQ